MIVLTYLSTLYMSNKKPDPMESCNMSIQSNFFILLLKIKDKDKKLLRMIRFFFPTNFSSF